MNLRIGPYPLTLRELSGGLGDLGVLIPLEAALIAVNGLNPTTTLLGVGAIYILAGLYFRIPMPVQPLKALSVIAIAHSSAPAVIAAAALLMAGALALLSVTRAISLLEKVFALPVVRGVQIGLGLLLLKSAYQMVFQRPFLLDGQQSYLDVGSLSVHTGALLGLGSVVLLLLLVRLRAGPATLVVVGVGVAVGLLASESSSVWRLGPMPVSFGAPSAGDFWTALVLLVAPQLPLTLANSVFATADAAKSYFGEQATKATPTRIAFSIALGNLWAGLTGGLPNCHGSGGLTAHYRLGARTPLATTFLGLVLIGIALLFGRSAWEVRSLLPAATLGALLFYVGVQHIFLGLKVKTTVQLSLAVIVAAVSTVFGGNLAIGAAVGLALYWSSRWLSKRYGWQPQDGKAAHPFLTRMIGALERIVPSG
ncbi:MAG: putative sulfate/molybdate transporter [Dehalococcoidia bacterium]|nr:putative sulfate/molybdate transporter [Dehalococcoidia bacterium]